MMSKSSSKHLTAKMKLLLVTLACVAAAVAAPAQKQKRDILPGDPRYGTDYHHQHHHTHENEVPHKTYGPPNHTPGTPLGNGYLAPTTTDFDKTSLPGQIYGVPESTQHIPQHVSKTYLQPAIQEAKKVHTSTPSFEIPSHDVKSQPTETFETQFKVPAPNAPVTSYGTPVIADAKTTTHIVQDTHVQPTHVTHEKVAITKVPVHKTQHVETKTIVTPEVKAPVGQDVFQHSVNEFKSVPSTNFDSFDNLGSTSFNSFPSFDTSFPKPSVPSALYSQQSFNTGFSNYPASYPTSYPTTYQSNYPATYPTSHQSNYPATYPLPSFEQHSQFQVAQPITVHVTKHAPISAPVFRAPQPVHVEYPKTTEVFQHSVPSFQHNVPSFQHNVPSFQHSVPSFQSNVQSFQTNVPSFQTNVPSFQTNVPSFQHSVPSFQHSVPSFQSTPESFQVPSYQPTTTFGKPIQNIRVDKESVTVENPLQTKTTIKTTKEYVQPTDENGGYIY